jgi:hypothetical protein
MDPVHGLLQRLGDTQGDIRAQAALTAEFLVMTPPNAEREPLHAALDAAAVLRWFDADLLRKVLEIPDKDARRRFEALKTFSFVEPYRGKDEVRNLHESTRLGWRKKIARENLERFRALSARTSSCFADDSSPAGRIEWIYHLQGGDPELGASELEKLDRQWSGIARPEDRYALTPHSKNSRIPSSSTAGHAPGVCSQSAGPATREERLRSWLKLPPKLFGSHAKLVIKPRKPTQGVSSVMYCGSGASWRLRRRHTMNSCL